MKTLSKSSNPALAGLLLLALLMASGIWLVLSFVGHERQRDLQDWQVTLGLMADARVDAVSKWVERQFTTLGHLAQNGSLQLYTQQLAQPRDAQDTSSDGQPVEPAQLSYLRNLLLATAEREGFQDPPRRGPTIQANVAFQADNGLALVDIHGKVIVATAGFPPPDEAMKAALHRALSSGEQQLRGLYLNDNKRPTIGFVVPVYALQAMSPHPTVIGALVGVKNAGSHLYPLLRARGLSTHSDEAMLLRRENGSVVYLSPLGNGTKPLQLQLAAGTVGVAGVWAVKDPGGFALKRDYAGKPVLVVSRRVAGTPWVLVQKIDAAEALRESNSHQRFLLTSFLLALLLTATLLVAAWRHGTSLREQRAASELREKTRQLQSQTRLLHAINDNITDYIYLLDHEGRFFFANQALSGRLGLNAEDLNGKTVASILGPEAAKPLETINRETLTSGESQVRTLQIEINGELRSFHAAFIPIPYESDRPSAVLTALHDVTLLEETQRRRERLMRQLVGALMKAIDLHDPYSTNHSARTAQVAVAIGRAMELEPAELETLETAANLCNLGKLNIPKEILTKKEKLTDEEVALVQRETEFAAEILTSIEFDGPVVETISQKNEHLDGSGHPRGLIDGEIIRGGRILAVANAFVAMVSTRAYREGMTIEEALDQLLRDSKSRYDRHVVAALFHVAENAADWNEWRTGGEE